MVAGRYCVVIQAFFHAPERAILGEFVIQPIWKLVVEIELQQRRNYRVLSWNHGIDKIISRLGLLIKSAGMFDGRGDMFV
jgi:hypothetical protein